MKVITNNTAFVQKNDIAYLIQSDLEIPTSIFMKVFDRDVIIINNRNRYDFVEFDAPEEIEFFKGIDWMIDYNEVKDLSEEGIIKLGQSIVKEKNRIAQKFNFMEINERKRNMGMVTQCELLDFKMYSLRVFLWLKQGHIKMKLPASVKTETGIKKLVKTMFNKKKN